MKITRWVQAHIALGEHDEVVGVIYGAKGINPFPMKQTSPQPLQRVREPTEPLILDHQAHADKVRKIYRQAQNY